MGWHGGGGGGDVCMDCAEKGPIPSRLVVHRRGHVYREKRAKKGK